MLTLHKTTRFFQLTGLFFALLYFSSPIESRAQSIFIKYNFAYEHVSLNKFNLNTLPKEHIKLAMSYNSYAVKNPETIKKLNGKDIIRIDMVYTKMQHEGNFDILLQNRLLELYQLRPEIFSSNLMSLRMIEQTGATRSTKHEFFHGIIIYYREYKGFEFEKKHLLQIVDEPEKHIQDSVILKVFERNKEWKKKLVVTDVTGSMYPYIGQVLLWLKLNVGGNENKFAFFNNKVDIRENKSILAEDKGVWCTDSQVFDEVIKTTLDAMNKGDQEEFNISSLLIAMDKYPNSGEVVMIADNFQDPYDMDLLDELKKRKVPIRIIICGGFDNINPNFLTIAKATGGSIHTIEKDIKDLTLLKEGEEFTLLGWKYIIKKGNFILLGKEEVAPKS